MLSIIYPEHFNQFYIIVFMASVTYLKSACICLFICILCFGFVLQHSDSFPVFCLV